MPLKASPLEPDDFPVTVDGNKIKTSSGQPVATAETAAIAQLIAYRLNEGEDRTEEGRWSA